MGEVREREERDETTEMEKIKMEQELEQRLLDMCDALTFDEDDAVDSESEDESRTNGISIFQVRGTMASRLSRRTWSWSKTLFDKTSSPKKKGSLGCA